MGSDAFRAPFDTAALLLEHCASAPSRRARAQQVADALWRDHALSFEECLESKKARVQVAALRCMAAAAAASDGVARAMLPSLSGAVQSASPAARGAARGGHAGAGTESVVAGGMRGLVRACDRAGRRSEVVSAIVDLVLALLRVEDREFNLLLLGYDHRLLVSAPLRWMPWLERRKRREILGTYHRRVLDGPHLRLRLRMGPCGAAEMRALASLYADTAADDEGGGGDVPKDADAAHRFILRIAQLHAETPAKSAANPAPREPRADAQSAHNALLALLLALTPTAGTRQSDAFFAVLHAMPSLLPP